MLIHELYTDKGVGDSCDGGLVAARACTTVVLVIYIETMVNITSVTKILVI